MSLSRRSRLRQPSAIFASLAGPASRAWLLAAALALTAGSAQAAEGPEVGAPGGEGAAEALSAEAAGLIERGAYAEAAPVAERALALFEARLGPQHPDVATALNQTGLIALYKGEYGRAEAFFRRSLAIREGAFGREGAGLRQSLHNLAALYYESGDFERAEAFFGRAFAIDEKTLGADHIAMATGLSNLALLYEAQGDAERAEPLHQRALAIREKQLGPAHPDVAVTLSNLGVLYHERGNLAQAEPLHRRALAIREKQLGPAHPDVASSLYHLARVHQARGEYDRAETLALGSLAIREQAFGGEHPKVARALVTLATIRQGRGRANEAEPLFLRALAVREKALDARHPEVATSAHQLASLYAARGDRARALAFFARAADGRERLLRTQLGLGSEARKRALLATLREETDAQLTFHLRRAPDDPAALALAFTTVLQRKGRSLDALVDANASLRRSASPALRAALDALAAKRAELSARLYAPYDARRAQAGVEAATTLRTELDALENQVAAQSAVFRAQSEPITLERVRALLPADAALLELVRYRPYDFDQPRQPWGDERYAVYLLQHEGPPRFLELGAASAIDAAVARARATMAAPQSVEGARGALRALDALVLAPVRRLLGPVPHLLLAPDGELNLLPFEALVDEQGRYLLETTLVTYLSSGRDLLRFQAPRPPRSAPLIVAGPAYGPGKPFVALPGAAAEAREVRAYFPGANLWQGQAATKEAISGVHAPLFLHVATHGFFKRPGASPTPKVANLRGLSVESVAPTPAPTPTDDPIDALDRAGLALAGANRHPEAIISARELAGLDLDGTQLVVLSACASGLGQVASGEGVYGLRRALTVAGAAAQVTSLWDVNDAATQRLMGIYYGELAAGRGRSEALRQARLELRRDETLAHPFYWAAFVPSGDWRPLDRGSLEAAKRGADVRGGACGCHVTGAPSRGESVIALVALGCAWQRRRGRQRPSGRPAEPDTAPCFQTKLTIESSHATFVGSCACADADAFGQGLEECKAACSPQVDTPTRRTHHVCR